MRILTYNVNGIRAAIKKGLLEWISEHDYDVLCFQETKSQPDQVDPRLFVDLGYHAYWHSALKKGYSGVLTLSRQPADSFSTGMGKKIIDDEGRILRTDYGAFSLLNCYFPSGSSGELRHAFKMKFLKLFKPFVKKLLKERDQLIVVGDYNIVHQGIDIHNPKRKDNPSGYRPEERKWLDLWFKSLFDDAFRSSYPDKQEFSWWSYRAGSRERNKGWRIDYISCAKNLEMDITEAGHFPKAQHSDHCPVFVHLKK